MENYVGMAGEEQLATPTWPESVATAGEPMPPMYEEDVPTWVYVEEWPCVPHKQTVDVSESGAPSDTEPLLPEEECDCGTPCAASESVAQIAEKDETDNALTPPLEPFSELLVEVSVSDFPGLDMNEQRPDQWQSTYVPAMTHTCRRKNAIFRISVFNGTKQEIRAVLDNRIDGNTARHMYLPSGERCPVPDVLLLEPDKRYDYYYIAYYLCESRTYTYTAALSRQLDDGTVIPINVAEATVTVK